MMKSRVVLVSLHYAEYGSRLALALAEIWDVLLILYRDNLENELGPGYPSLLEHPGLRVVTLERPSFAVSVITNASRLNKTIAAFGPEVVHCQEDPRDELILVLPFMPSVPLVLTVHDPKAHSGSDSHLLRFSRRRLYRRVLRRTSDLFITHGESLASELETICPWTKGKVRCVPHGPLGTWESGSLQSPGEMRLLFFGRIEEYKGLRFFVDSVIELRNQGLAVVGVVAGRGSDLELHRTRMETQGCFEIYNQYIPPEDIPRIFREATIVVLPYTDGTQSGVAAMALGFGRPVVATAVGSVPELVRNGVNGVLVPPADTEALVNALRSVLTDHQLWARLSAGARELRDGELSWKAIASETIEVYESAIGTATGRPSVTTP